MQEITIYQELCGKIYSILILRAFNLRQMACSAHDAAKVDPRIDFCAPTNGAAPDRLIQRIKCLSWGAHGLQPAWSSDKKIDPAQFRRPAGPGGGASIQGLQLSRREAFCASVRPIRKAPCVKLPDSSSAQRNRRARGPRLASLRLRAALRDVGQRVMSGVGRR